MSYWKTYINRLNVNGSTNRERHVNYLKETIIRDVVDNPSSKPILLNGKPTHLIINSSTQPYYKEFQSLPSQEINIGDYVEWANSHWLVATCDSDDEIYKDGKLHQCNYLLKWQNELGQIIERWAFIQSASKYNDGTDGNAVIILGSDQLSIQMPLDSETIKLRKSMGKKFLIDNNKENPTAYELTGTGNVVDTFNGYGLTSWIVKECKYSIKEDDIKYGVCDYFDYNNSDNTTDTQNKEDNISQEIQDTIEKEEDTETTEENKTTILTAKISGVSNLKIGNSRTCTVKFTDENGIEVTDCDFKWKVMSDFEVERNEIGNKIELCVNDELAIGSSFLVQILDSKDLIIAERKVTVIDVF